MQTHSSLKQECFKVRYHWGILIYDEVFTSLVASNSIL